MTEQPEITPEQREGLRIARKMLAAGIPIFSAAPCPDTCRTPGHAKREYHEPLKWDQISVADGEWQLGRWRPGWALAAIGGETADFLDEDPRHDGDASVKELQNAGVFPRVFGVQRTKSGGRHFVISPLGEHRAEQIMPGLDYQGGEPLGQGRAAGKGTDGKAYIWLAPTTGRSKDPEHAGEIGTYVWEEEPDFEMLAEFAGADDSGEIVRDKIIASRGIGFRKTAESAERAGQGRGTPSFDPADPFATGDQIAASGRAPGTVREFTRAGAEAFVRPALAELRLAQVGGIEGAANRAAVLLSHFVPEFWDANTAYAILVDNLSHTAYDPSHPASGWTAEKFRPVLDGRRPAADPWKAVKLADVPEQLHEQIAAVQGDAVDALIAEMLTPGQIKDRPRPAPLIKGYLSMDSESWLIGAPGSKKSFVALDMALHVAAGMSWQGLRTAQGLVVYIVAEGSSGVGARVRAWEMQHGRGAADELLFLPRPVQAKSVSEWAVLVEACRRLQPSMIVIDTQARVTAGLSENDATEMGVYVQAQSILREVTGACALTVHHTGKAGLDARGSSAINGAQTTELTVSEMKGQKLGVLLRTTKQKDLPELEPLLLGFAVHEVGVDEDGDPITSLALMPPDAPGIAEFLRLSGQEERSEETVNDAVGEPREAWIFRASGDSLLRARLLQIVWEIGQGGGLTQAEMRKGVANRWYGGKVARASRDAGVSEDTLRKAWKHFEGDGTGPHGEALLVPSGGERRRIHPLIAEWT